MPSGEEHAWRDRICRECGLVGLCRIRARDDMFTDRRASIVGYILAGIVVGPAGFGLIADNAALSSIGEIGVLLLLFVLGLEFSFEKLVRLRSMSSVL